MALIKVIISGIDWLSEKAGWLASWIVIIAIALICYNVFMRYTLNNPTTWSFDVNYMLAGTMFILGMSFVTKHIGHIKIDLLSRRFSPRTQILLDTAFILILILPAFFMISKYFWVNAITSFANGEKLCQTSWYPIAWPFKTVLAIGFSLFFLQTTSNFVKNIIQLVTGSEIQPTTGGKEL